MVAINKAMFVAEVANLQSIIDAIRAQQGSAAARHQNAIHTALGQDVTFATDDMPSPPDLVEAGEGKASVNLGDLASFVKALTEWADQQANEAVTVILKATSSDDKLGALREQYTEKREFVEALATVLSMQKIDVSDVVIPQLRGAKTAGTTTRRTSKNSKGQWYRVVDGVRKDQSESQNSLSSVAFYHGAKIMQIEGPLNKGRGVNTADLENFLRKLKDDDGNALVPSPLGKSWSIEVDGVIYGLDVKSDSDEKSDEEE